MDLRIAAWVVGAVILLPGMPIRAQSDSGIKAGAARVDITPPLPAPYAFKKARSCMARPCSPLRET